MAARGSSSATDTSVSKQRTERVETRPRRGPEATRLQEQFSRVHSTLVSSELLNRADTRPMPLRRSEETAEEADEAR